MNQLGKQWSLWAAALNSPVSVISEDDPASAEAFRKAYRFFLFVFVIVFLLRVPFFDVFLGVDMVSAVNFPALLVLNAASFIVFILILYVLAKILRGRGGFRSSVIAGIYLSAFWPLLILVSYLTALSRQLDGVTANRMIAQWWLEPLVVPVTVALLLFLYFYLILKSMPAIRYVHGVGNIRAIIICGFGYVLAYEVQNWLTVKLLFEVMRLTGRSGSPVP